MGDSARRAGPDGVQGPRYPLVRVSLRRESPGSARLPLRLSTSQIKRQFAADQFLSPLQQLRVSLGESTSLPEPGQITLDLSGDIDVSFLRRSSMSA